MDVSAHCELVTRSKVHLDHAGTRVEVLQNLQQHLKCKLPVQLTLLLVGLHQVEHELERHLPILQSGSIILILHSHGLHVYRVSHALLGLLHGDGFLESYLLDYLLALCIF